MALFRQKPFIRPVAGTAGDALARRASFERQLVQVPARLNDAGREALAAYRAAGADTTLRANLFAQS